MNPTRLWKMRWLRPLSAVVPPLAACLLSACAPPGADDGVADPVAAEAPALTASAAPTNAPLLRPSNYERAAGATAAALPSHHMSPHDGSVVVDPQVEIVRWGSRVDVNLIDRLAHFYRDIMKSDYLAWLGEYATARGTPGTGDSFGYVTITPTNTSSSLTERDVVDELKRDIASGMLRPAAPNVLYMVYLPPGVSLTADGGARSCVDFCAFHHWDDGLRYAIMVDLGAGSPCNGVCGGASDPFSNLTTVSTHELVETITDPDGSGWYDDALGHAGEIGDLCNLDQAFRVFNGDYWDVERQWSNARNECVSGQVTRSALDAGGDVATRTPTNLDLFEVRSDGAVYSSYWANGPWSTFRLTNTNLAPANAQVAAVSRTPDNLDIFFIGNDGALWSSWWHTGSGWNTFRVSNGGLAPPGARITATAKSPNNIDVFFVGNNGAVYSSYWYFGAPSWTTFQLSGASVAPPGAGIAAVARTATNVDVFWVGNDGGIWSAYWYEGTPRWTVFRTGGTNLAPAGASVGAAARSSTNIDVFTLGRDGGVWAAAWADGSPWVTSRVGQAGLAPAGGGIGVAARSRDNLDVFYVGNDGGVWTTYWSSGQPWATFRESNAGLAAPGANVAVAARTQKNLDAFFVGKDGGFYTSYWYDGAPSWNTFRLY